MKIKRNFDYSALILGLLSLFTAYVIFKNPTVELASTNFLIGFLAIILGIYQIWLFGQIFEYTRLKNKILLLSGILSIIIGSIFEMHLDTTITLYLFAIWFLVIGITEFSISYVYHQFNNKFYWYIVAGSIISILLGIILLFNPLLSLTIIAYLIAANFLIYGIVKILSLY